MKLRLLDPGTFMKHAVCYYTSHVMPNMIQEASSQKTLFVYNRSKWVIDTLVSKNRLLAGYSHKERYHKFINYGHYIESIVIVETTAYKLSDRTTRLHIKLAYSPH